MFRAGRFRQNWPRFVPNWTNLGLFKIKFPYILADPKVPRFVTFGANLPILSQMWPVCRCIYTDHPSIDPGVYQSKQDKVCREEGDLLFEQRNTFWFDFWVVPLTFSPLFEIPLSILISPMISLWFWLIFFSSWSYFDWNLLM